MDLFLQKTKDQRQALSKEMQESAQQMWLELFLKIAGDWGNSSLEDVFRFYFILLYFLPRWKFNSSGCVFELWNCWRRIWRDLRAEIFSSA